MVLPDFRFFAPNPASNDYSLRVWTAPIDAILSERSLVTEIRYDDPLRFGFCWNPKARTQKIFRDQVDGLLVSLRDERKPSETDLPDWCLLSYSYLTCLAVASSQVAAGRLTQFEVVAYSDGTETVLVKSRWHTIGNQ